MPRILQRDALLPPLSPRIVAMSPICTSIAPVSTSVMSICTTPTIRAALSAQQDLGLAPGRRRYGERHRREPAERAMTGVTSRDPRAL